METSIITLTCLLSERWYCLQGFLSNFDNLDYDKKLINLVIVSNSNDDNFNNYVERYVKRFEWLSFKLIKTGFPIIECLPWNLEATNDLRFTQTTKGFNIMREEILKTDCKYGWFWEDDVAIPPDSAQKLLKIFEIREDVGAAFTFFTQRWHEVGHWPLVWDFFEKKLFGNNDTSKEVQVVASQKYPSPDKWVEQIGSASTGCVMIKKEALQKFEFEMEYKKIKYHDCATGLKLRELGYSCFVDWSLKGKHLHKTGEIIY